jgi:hypothetical protein
LRIKTAEELAIRWEKEILKIFLAVLPINNIFGNIFKVSFSHIVASSSEVLFLKINIDEFFNTTSQFS